MEADQGKESGGKHGVDHYIAEVLPEEKAEYIRMQKQERHKVIMIGDGVNDSPALLHNLSTLVISIYNMTDLLDKPAGLLEERNGEA